MFNNSQQVVSAFIKQLASSVQSDLHDALLLATQNLNMRKVEFSDSMGSASVTISLRNGDHIEIWYDFIAYRPYSINDYKTYHFRNRPVVKAIQDILAAYEEYRAFVTADKITITA